MLLKHLPTPSPFLDPVNLQIEVDGFAQFLDLNAVPPQRLDRFSAGRGQQIRERPLDREGAFDSAEIAERVILGLVGGDSLAVFCFFDEAEKGQFAPDNNRLGAEFDAIAGLAGVGEEFADVVGMGGDKVEDALGERFAAEDPILEGGIGV
jgi:hypothetical protein